MKAHRYGTLSEQARFEANWGTSTTRTDEGVYRRRRCDNCEHSELGTSRSGSLRCNTLGCATRESAICDHWKPQTWPGTADRQERAEFRKMKDRADLSEPTGCGNCEFGVQWGAAGLHQYFCMELACDAGPSDVCKRHRFRIGEAPRDYKPRVAAALNAESGGDLPREYAWQPKADEDEPACATCAHFRGAGCGLHHLATSEWSTCRAHTPAPEPESTTEGDIMSEVTQDPPSPLEQAAAAATELAVIEHQTQQHVAEIDRQFGDLTPYNLDRIVSETRFLLGQASDAMLEAGKRLIQIKEHEEHGQFLAAVEQIGIDRYAASRLMKAAIKFGNLRSNAKLMAAGKTKLIELAVLDDDEVEALAEGGTVRGLVLDEIDRMTTRELRAALRKSKEDANTEKEGLQKTDELSIESERAPEKVEDKTATYVHGLQIETVAITSKIQASLVARINAVFDICGESRADYARLLAAQHLGQIVSAARAVAADYDLVPDEDAGSAFTQAAGDDEAAVWAEIDAMSQEFQGATGE
jgi:hypothetical protein